MHRNKGKGYSSSAREVVRVCCEIDDFQTMKKFFSEIFTPAEIQDVALRWRLMTMLHEGVPQREIADDLGISLCKITRGSRVLKGRGSVTKRIIEMKAGMKDAHGKSLRQHTRS